MNHNICLEHLEEIQDYVIKTISDKIKSNKNCIVLLSKLLSDIDNDIESHIYSVKQSQKINLIKGTKNKRSTKKGTKKRKYKKKIGTHLFLK